MPILYFLFSCEINQNLLLEVTSSSETYRKIGAQSEENWNFGDYNLFI